MFSARFFSPVNQCRGAMPLSRVLRQAAQQRSTLTTVSTQQMRTLGRSHTCPLPSVLWGTLRAPQGSVRALRAVHVRTYATGTGGAWNQANRTTGMYITAIAVLTCAASYAAVPLYRLFCQATGYGGTVQESKDTDLSNVLARRQRPIRVRFNADTSTDMRWQFRPQQSEIKIVPGESALAFYTATNPTDQPITGISTYNVIPFEAGPYFNKIQCFCFEEQRLNPHEQVDMPVFFYIDPEFAEDPGMSNIREITLSYTFFESRNFDYNKWSASMPSPTPALAAA